MLFQKLQNSTSAKPRRPQERLPTPAQTIPPQATSQTTTPNQFNVPSPIGEPTPNQPVSIAPMSPDSEHSQAPAPTEQSSQRLQQNLESERNETTALLARLTRLTQQLSQDRQLATEHLERIRI
jgi:hypothetical protein